MFHCTRMLFGFQYFESLLQEVKEGTEREISNAVEKAVPLKKLQAKLDRCVKEKKFLDDVSVNSCTSRVDLRISMCFLVGHFFSNLAI